MVNGEGRRRKQKRQRQRNALAQSIIVKYTTAVLQIKFLCYILRTESVSDSATPIAIAIGPYQENPLAGL